MGVAIQGTGVWSWASFRKSRLSSSGNARAASCKATNELVVSAARCFRESGCCNRARYTVDADYLEKRCMKRLRVVVSLPNDNAYQHEQKAAARSTAQRLGLDLQVMQADDDSSTQSQQLVKIVESSAEARPNAFLVEPLSVTGLRRVAEAAVAKGMAWVMSNSEVDYITQLRKSPSVPVFTVTQGQREIGQLQGKQLAALLPLRRICPVRRGAEHEFCSAPATRGHGKYQASEYTDHDDPQQLERRERLSKYKHPVTGCDFSRGKF